MIPRILLALAALAALCAVPRSIGQVPVKEDWESQPTVPSHRLRSAAESWQFCRGEGMKEGKAEVVEGKGKKKGKALRLSPDGEQGLIGYAVLGLPPLEVQEFRFSVRGDGEEALALRLFVKASDRKEVLRLNIGEGRISINGDRRATLGMVRDEEGWADVLLRIDGKSSSATLRVGEEEKTLEIPKWQEGKLAFQFQANFDKARNRQPVLLDDVSWLGEGGNAP